MLKPTIPKKPNPKRLSLQVSFDLWNELIVVGDPKQVVEELLNDWLMKRMQDRDTYFVSNDRRVIDLRMAPITEVEIAAAQDLLNRAIALGQNKKAALLEIRLDALKTNYIQDGTVKP